MLSISEVSENVCGGLRTTKLTGPGVLILMYFINICYILGASETGIGTIRHVSQSYLRQFLLSLLSNLSLKEL